MEYLVPSKTLFREAIRNKNSSLSDIGLKGNYGGCFEKKIGRGEVLFKKSKLVVETPFSWWELLSNMPDMQSLKALLLFVKEQC